MTETIIYRGGRLGALEGRPGLGRTTQTCGGRSVGEGGTTLGAAEEMGGSKDVKTQTRAKGWGR